MNYENFQPHLKLPYFENKELHFQHFSYSYLSHTSQVVGSQGELAALTTYRQDLLRAVADWPPADPAFWH